jgi:hypothetical protein
MNLTQLADYIVQTHHAYVKNGNAADPSLPGKSIFKTW